MCTVRYKALKEGEPCTDCGGVFHHAAMQWITCPGAGEEARGEQLGPARFRRKTILEEIESCELVCATCHAVRTFDRSRNGV